MYEQLIVSDDKASQIYVHPQLKFSHERVRTLSGSDSAIQSL